MKATLCNVQGIYSYARGSAASGEGNGELWCCSRCSVEKSLSLLTDFSSHRKHRVQKTKSCTFLCIHPLVARTRQNPWFSPSHSLAFLPAKLSRAKLASAVPLRKAPPGRMQWLSWILWPLWGATRAHSKSHQHIKPPSHLVQVCPSS